MIQARIDPARANNTLLMKYDPAPEIKQQVDALIDILEMNYIVKDHVHCIRSYDAKTRAYARIWGMAKLFQDVLGLTPHYIIEVNDRMFKKLSEREQMKTLVHELMHIPKTFSGALLSHRGPHHAINDREVEKLLKARMK